MITNKWLNPYQRSFQQIKAKLIESLTTIKDKNGQTLITDYSEGNIPVSYTHLDVYKRQI